MIEIMKGHYLHSSREKHNTCCFTMQNINSLLENHSLGWNTLIYGALVVIDWLQTRDR